MVVSLTEKQIALIQFALQVLIDDETTDTEHRNTIKSNEIIGGRLINGYDYTNQAWVVNGRYVRCGHGSRSACQCFGTVNEGVQTGAGFTA